MWKFKPCRFVFLACISILIQAANGYYADDESALKTSLMKKQDKAVPPKKTANDTITVKVGLSVTSIESLDIETSMLTSHIWLKIMWTDYRLAWNPEDNNDITKLAIPYKDIWRPDIVPYNSALEEFVISADYHVVVDNTGQVIFVPHTRLQTFCNTHLGAFPFDRQSCEIKIGSWVYSSEVITLEPYHDTETVDISSLHKGTNWEVLDTKYRIHADKYACCKESYYSATGLLVIQRHSHLMLSVYVGPAVCFGLVIPVVFLLPADNSHKLILGGSLLISQVVLLEMMAEALPVTHFSVPDIAQYLLANIVLLSLSLACSALVIHCWSRAERAGTGVPRILEKIFLGPIASCLRVSKEDYISQRGTNQREDDVNMNDSESGTAHIIVNDYNRHGLPAEWRQLSAVFDRLLFVLFLIATILVMFAMVRHAYV